MELITEKKKHPKHKFVVYIYKVRFLQQKGLSGKIYRGGSNRPVLIMIHYTEFLDYFEKDSDIFSPQKVKNWIENLTINGKRLPRYDDDGISYAYVVTLHVSPEICPKWYKSKQLERFRSPKISLFPGYSGYNEKTGYLERLRVMEHGLLRD